MFGPQHGPSLVLDSPATHAIDTDDEIRGMDDAALLAGIDRLRHERNALIVAHNYQIPPIQDLADFVGDSLELSRHAAASESRLIVFCGVHFMAETAAILCPDARVLLPDPLAGCSLAAAVTVDEVRTWRAEHPDGVVVSYINTDAAVKAESDYCCTSANAVEVVRAIPAELEVLFLPDMFLGLAVPNGPAVHAGDEARRRPSQAARLRRDRLGIARRLRRRRSIRPGRPVQGRDALARLRLVPHRMGAEIALGVLVPADHRDR
jgi:hypothetical protein